MLSSAAIAANNSRRLKIPIDRSARFDPTRDLSRHAQHRKYNPAALWAMNALQNSSYDSLSMNPTLRVSVRNRDGIPSLIIKGSVPTFHMKQMIQVTLRPLADYEGLRIVNETVVPKQ